jgi:hypothetical protein
MVSLKEHAEELKGSFLDLGDILRDAFSQTFDAIVAGTRDLSDAFKGIGISIGKQLFEATLKEKFKFDGTFNANILELGGNVTKWLGGAFSSVFGGASDQASSLSSLLGGGGGGGSGGGTGSGGAGGGLIGGIRNLVNGQPFNAPAGQVAIGQRPDGSYIYRDKTKAELAKDQEFSDTVGGGVAGAAGGYAGATTGSVYTPADGYYVIDENSDNSLAAYKWTGFFFGMGMAHQWPAARLGGVMAADPVSTSLPNHIGSVSGASTAEVIVTAPSGAVTTSTCSTTCAFSIDRRQGAHWAQVEYLDSMGAVLSTEAAVLVDGTSSASPGRSAGGKIAVGGRVQ